jgi:hypothetical protein
MRVRRIIMTGGRIFALGVLIIGAFAGTAVAADLTVTGVDTSAMTTDCQTLAASGSVSATVRNIGNVATGAGFRVLFFEDRNGNGTYEFGTDLALGDALVAGSLAAGDDTTVTTAVNDTVTFAGNLVYAFADADDDIAETDETNNINQSGAGCQFQPTPGPFALVEEWNWNSSTTAPTHVQVMMTPIVANITDDNADGLINDDDIPDVVFSTFQSSFYYEDSVVRAVRGDTGAEIFTTPLTSDRDVLGEGSIAVGDIDGDGIPEIIAVEDISETHDINSFGRLIVFEHDGTFKFTSDLLADGRLRWGGAALADLNQDGTPEIVVGRQILDNTGSILATGTSRRGDNVAGPLSTVADIDRDGKPDLVAGFTVYDVTIDGGNNITGMTVKWEAMDALEQEVPGDGFPGVANFDDDDNAEVVVVSNSNVWLFDDDGSHIWGPSAIPAGGRGGPPNIDDFDADGAVEVGTAGASRYVVFETDGTIRWANVTVDNSSNLTGSSVFDFEGDGAAEVIYKDETNLRVYSGFDGTVLADVLTGSGTTYENPVIADVDKDGNAEIIVCANNYAFGTETGIQVFGDANDQWVNTRRIWNQHTYHITNVNDDGTIPMVEADNWINFNSFRSQEGGSLEEIFAAPDLTSSFITLDDALCPDSLDITARIGNGGSNVAAAPVNVAFYDGDPNAGGTLLGSATTASNLNGGEFEDVTLTLSPPLTGAHTICVAADDDGTGAGMVSECNEDNNQCCAQFADICLPCDPDPHTQGYWNRQCLGAGLITPGRNGNGRGPQTVLEPDFLKTLVPAVDARLQASIFVPPTYNTCEDGIDAVPPSDKCEKALKQYTALLLNIESDRLQVTCSSDLSAYGCSATSIGDLLPELAALINAADFDSCNTASSCAGALNEGLGTIQAGPLAPAPDAAFAPIGGAYQLSSSTVGTAAPQPSAAPAEGGTSAPAVTSVTVVSPMAPAAERKSERVAPQAPAAEADGGGSVFVSIPLDAKRAIERHLAVLATRSAADEARQTSEDALLTALGGGYAPEVRLQIVRGLLGAIDVAYNSLLAEHLKDILAEARELDKAKVATAAARLLRSIEPVSEEGD